ncbi:MAG TPA: C45 family peptidase [Myxococcota bacterium]|nr:C45 family peptidase [Myxococcota bacterium]
MPWFPSFCSAGLLALLVAACGSGGDQAGHAPSRTELRGLHILRLTGTPYEMGRQQGELMTSEIQELADFTDQDQGYSLLLAVAETNGLTDAALEYSYPEVLDECRGMVEAVEAAGVQNWSQRKCVTAAYLLVVLENTVGWTQGGCSQFVAAGSATKDGALVHARNLDWPPLPPLVHNPTLIVRRPQGGIPYVEVGFPGEVFSLSGINENGLVVALNEAYAREDKDEQGRSHPQMARRILEQAESVAEAETLIAAQDHASAETIVISDAAAGEAAVFEISANHMGIRRLSADGVVYATNHFVQPEMQGIDVERTADDDSLTRYARFEQLLEPGGANSILGQIDLAAAVGVLRDTYNPYTGESHPPELIDGGGSIGNNGTVHAMVFLPARRALYVAMGEQPVPPRPFVGFSLDELFEEPNAAPADPAQIE